MGARLAVGPFSCFLGPNSTGSGSVSMGHSGAPSAPCIGSYGTSREELDVPSVELSLFNLSSFQVLMNPFDYEFPS